MNDVLPVETTMCRNWATKRTSQFTTTCSCPPVLCHLCKLGTVQNKAFTTKFGMLKEKARGFFLFIVKNTGFNKGALCQLCD